MLAPKEILKGKAFYFPPLTGKRWPFRLLPEGSASSHVHPPVGQQRASLGPRRPMAVFALPPDFPPVFHIKLKDQVLLEGEAATLLCLPAACPAPRISWMKGEETTSPPQRGAGKWPQGQGMFSGKWQPGVPRGGLHSAAPPAPPLPPDKQSLRSEPSVIIVSCKDGRQMLSIPRAGKRHAGLYECSATNVLGSATSSCTVAVAREPGAGTKGDVMGEGP